MFAVGHTLTRSICRRESRISVQTAEAVARALAFLAQWATKNRVSVAAEQESFGVESPAFRGRELLEIEMSLDDQIDNREMMNGVHGRQLYRQGVL